MTSKRKAKKDTRMITRRKLPAYAREMMQDLMWHGDRVYVYEWKELFDSFRGPKSTSVIVLRRLKRISNGRHPIQEPPEVECCGDGSGHCRTVLESASQNDDRQLLTQVRFTR